MGRLLTVHPCPICNYYVEDTLNEGGSGIAPLFLKNHYVLAICKDCHNLVSVIIPNTEQETQDALKTARDDIIQMEADVILGDRRAREMLPLFKQSVDSFASDETPTPETRCTMCGSANIEIQTDVNGAQFDAQDAWILCPNCKEGHLLVETTGAWD
jgi:uncharacterized protein with PIN domain